MEFKEIHALANLLDDPDAEVCTRVKEKLLSAGAPIVPALENAWENAGNTLLQNRIEKLIRVIQFKEVSSGLKEWVVHGPHDLFQGILLVCRHRYPGMDEAKIRSQIDQIRRDVWLEMI